ncbi:uncharacterized protein BDV14DRAFT_171886 [Aspergillus stella-maris]|uniref:uncharacterized protein n=1 Tax=Aspergillus stella-maris TaxID=1810926 RepID=UPI003CCD193D
MATPTKIGLLNTSWTCHRLSPLHHANIELKSSSLLQDTTALNLHATRLRDHLTNSLADAAGWRAAPGGGEDEPSSAGGLSALGALQNCTWEGISSLDFVGSDGIVDEEGGAEGKEPAGLLITLAYENSTYRAALLSLPSDATSQSGSKTETQNQSQVPQKRKRGRPSLKSSSSSGNPNPNSKTSTNLPLLLTRLPKPLRENLISFLSSNFDTYISPLRISSAGLASLLESYVAALQSSSSSTQTRDGEGEAVQVQDIIRELSLTLSFAPPIAPSLKALNLGVPRETFGAFLTSSNTPSSRSGFDSVLRGLSEYVRNHLAMELGLPLPGASTSDPSDSGKGDDASLVGGYVRLTKIACAGFVVTSEGRLKIVAKDIDTDADGDGRRNKGALRGGEALLRGVLERAAGVGVFRDEAEEE